MTELNAFKYAWPVLITRDTRITSKYRQISLLVENNRSGQNTTGNEATAS